MDEVFARSRVLARDGSPVRLPIAHMVCNQTPPIGGKPSLMTFREVLAAENCDGQFVQKETIISIWFCFRS